MVAHDHLSEGEQGTAAPTNAPPIPALPYFHWRACSLALDLEEEQIKTLGTDGNYYFS